MKILHKIRAALLRRQLVRQRAENIANLRAGRREAKVIAIRMAREIRLSGASHTAKLDATRLALPVLSAKGNIPGQRKLSGQISAILAKCPTLARRTA